MSRDTRDKLEDLLTHVTHNRRDLLKRLLLGTGALAILTPISSIVAEAQATDDPAQGAKGKGKGRDGKPPEGRGKGKGRDGEPPEGRGKGKGRDGEPPQGRGGRGRGKGRGA